MENNLEICILFEYGVYMGEFAIAVQTMRAVCVCVSCRNTNFHVRANTIQDTAPHTHTQKPYTHT